MKKVFFVMLLFCSMATVSMAQPRAIGGRVGYNIEFSYQHAIGARNMLDISAGATNVWNGWAYTEATVCTTGLSVSVPASLTSTLDLA